MVGSGRRGEASGHGDSWWWRGGRRRLWGRFWLPQLWCWFGRLVVLLAGLGNSLAIERECDDQRGHRSQLFAAATNDLAFALTFVVAQGHLKRPARTMPDLRIHDHVALAIARPAAEQAIDLAQHALVCGTSLRRFQMDLNWMAASCRLRPRSARVSSAGKCSGNE